MNYQIDNESDIRSIYSVDLNEHRFSVVDIIGYLVKTNNPNRYWSDYKKSLAKKSIKFEDKIVKLKILSKTDGKEYLADTVNKQAAIELINIIDESPRTPTFLQWVNYYGTGSNEFTLMYKNVPVVMLTMSNTGNIEEVDRVISHVHLPIGSYARGNLDVSYLRNWWNSRSIPTSREGLKQFLNRLNVQMPMELAVKSIGVSLSDHYWIKPEGANLMWEDVNFFTNEFSSDIGDVMFDPDYTVDKNNVSYISPDNTSDGVLKKRWYIIDGKRYLIKGSSNSANQEVANEILATMICERLGIPHTKYELINIDGEYYCKSECFIDEKIDFVTASSIIASIRKNENLSDYENYVRRLEAMQVDDARRHVNMMLVLDYLIVNTDRHLNNFGILRDANTLEWLKVTPIFDSGTAMWSYDPFVKIDPHKPGLQAKPFALTHTSQINFVDDFSWCKLSKLVGVASDYEDILNEVNDNPYLRQRNKELANALEERIKTLQAIINQKKRYD